MTSTPAPAKAPPSQAEIFQRIRAERGLSQEAFAELTGLHRVTVAHVEAGTRWLTLVSTIRQVAERLEIPADDLMAGVP